MERVITNVSGDGVIETLDRYVEGELVYAPGLITFNDGGISDKTIALSPVAVCYILKILGIGNVSKEKATE